MKESRLDTIERHRRIIYSLAPLLDTIGKDRSYSPCQGTRTTDNTTTAMIPHV